MKIYIHIANNCSKNDQTVMVEVECDGVPRRGELFYLRQSERARLEEQARLVDRPEDRFMCYRDWYYGKNKDRLSFDDAIYIYDVSWEWSKDGVYRCHVELCDNHRIPVEK